MPEFKTSMSGTTSGVTPEPLPAALRVDPRERFPREFQLLLACLRWPQDELAARRIQACGDTELDWPRFAQLTDHHRVQPLVHRALQSAGVTPPAAIATALKKAATRNAFGAMGYLAEAQRLTGLLHDAGIPVRLLKGLPLSQRAFGEWALRDVGDLDLLISPEDEERADTVLLADGLRRGEPAALLTPRRRRSYRKHAKDYTYEPGAAGFEIDLHWRLLRNPRMDGNRLAAVAPDEIHIGGIALHVLPEIHSFLYLCVHGTLDGWFRLKPVADVAALWRRFSPTERGDAIALARRECVSSELAGALTLAMHLGVIGESEMPSSIVLQAADSVCRRIVVRALDHLRRYDYMPGAASAGSWELKRYEMSLRSDFRYQVEILRRVLFRPRVWERFNLPDAVYPLYALVSPLEWLLFHGGRRLGLKPPPDTASAALGNAPRRQPEKVQASRAGSVGRGVLGRWRRTGWAAKILVAEAALYLLAARAALSLLPLRRTLERVQRPSSTPPPPESEAVIQQIRWAVVAVSHHAPVRFVCFPQALAAHAMLRRRGIPSRLHYGVRRSADGRLRAHTWLEAGGETMLGGESSPLFSRIHAWPSQRILPETERRDGELSPLPYDGDGTQL